MARPRLLAAALGAVGACAFVPLGLWPLGLAAIAGFIVLLRRAQSRAEAAQIGWLFGWAHLTLANNWIATAFTYQSDMPAFLGWLAVPLVCAYLAIYPALAALAAHRLVGKSGTLAFGFLLAAAWIVTEWLRSWVFTGYPWPPLGLMLLGGFDAPGIARALPWLGTYALSGLVIVIATALVALAEGRRWAVLAASGAVLAALMHWPANRGPEGTVPFVLIQPLIPQVEINDASKFEEHFSRIARLTMPGNDARRLVLWPESGVPDYLRDGYPQRYYFQMTVAADPAFARRRIGAVIGPASLLLTGAVDLEIGEREGQLRAVGAYNAITPIDGEGNLGRRYAKAHLVPYGEYLALRWLLEPLGASRLVAGSIDFIPGPGPQTLDLGPFGRAGMQICYEIVFSGEVVDRANRPDYIFNPSNDGWFGAWGPPQHLAQARMRAIEEGLPVLRSTTTGISAVIDADGVVRQHIGRQREGRIDGYIPPAKPPTLFARLGNALPLGWAIVLAALSLVAMRRRGG
ncbi:MAG: apolipoprotein N-acyltransferase [Sphingomonadales bacterium BRH_c42]|nr:MAG: apolipoprotein N-acyltransferase [Sphingomonadales bacterium BRH_c42]